MKVEFYRHSLGQAEIDALARVVGSLFLTTGPEARAFEAELAAYLGVVEAVGVSSCTAAMHLALVALGVGPGDEVVVPPTSFVATANVAVYAGATPVFADVEADTGLLDPAAVEAALTPRTRAVIPVHLYGQMADVHALQAVALRHDLAMIEDGAHCVEGRRDGARPGQVGRAACFSFYATKNLTCGEGGAIATNDRELAAHLRRLRLHGIDRDAADRYGARYRHWDQLELGYKANLTDLQAAMLRTQLPVLEARRARREQLCDRYDQGLAGLAGVRAPRLADGVVSARHLYPIEVDPARRDDVLAALGDRGIGVAVNFRPIHLMRWYRERFGTREGQFPNAERLGASTISLPLYPALTEAEQDYVIAAVREVIEVG